MPGLVGVSQVSALRPVRVLTLVRPQDGALPDRLREGRGGGEGVRLGRLILAVTWAHHLLVDGGLVGEQQSRSGIPVAFIRSDRMLMERPPGPLFLAAALLLGVTTLLGLIQHFRFVKRLKYLYPWVWMKLGEPSPSILSVRNKPGSGRRLLRFVRAEGDEEWLEVADAETERQRVLLRRAYVAHECAMLFVALLFLINLLSKVLG